MYWVGQRTGMYCEESDVVVFELPVERFDVHDEEQLRIYVLQKNDMQAVCGC